MASRDGKGFKPPPPKGKGNAMEKGSGGGTESDGRVWPGGASARPSGGRSEDDDEYEEYFRFRSSVERNPVCYTQYTQYGL